jgi:hypothetical protein
MRSCKYVIALILLGISSAVSAAIGNVTEQINKPAEIQRQKQTLDAKKGVGVETNDTIKTSQGKIGITFEDATRVQVNENSKLVIDDFVYNPKSKTGKLGAKIALGTVRYASGAIAHNSPRNVALSTPTATIAVRGTDFTATVEELGESTIVLLPSCPNDRPMRTVKDVEAACKTGEIEVQTDAGFVILNQPFQVTKVTSRDAPPSKPVILNLSEMAIGNLLILSPPPEVKRAVAAETKSFNALDVNALDREELKNMLDEQNKMFYTSQLEKNFLTNDFLGSLFDIIGSALDENFLAPVDPVLPDYRKASGIVVTRDEMNIQLCRDNGADIQCISTPTTQNSTLFQTQGTLEFKNRINQGGNTIITIVQR